MKNTPPLKESDIGSIGLKTEPLEKQNITVKLKPKLKIRRPMFIPLNGFIKSKVLDIAFNFHLCQRQFKSITNTILMYCFIITSYWFTIALNIFFIPINTTTNNLLVPEMLI